MDSVKASKKHQHTKGKKWKALQGLAKRLGIQGASADDNMNKILEGAAKKIDSLQMENLNLERQIKRLVRSQNVNADLQAQNLKLQQKLLAMESSPQSREGLIERLRSQIDNFKKNENQMLKTIEDLKLQIWPPPFFDAEK